MKKISFDLMNKHLTRDEMRAISGGSQGGSGDGLCSCKAGGSIIYETYVAMCDYCETVCYYSAPSHTSWICSGAW